MDANALVTEIQRHDFQDIDGPTVIFPLLNIEHKAICSMAPFPFTQKSSVWTEAVNVPNTPLVGAPTDIQAVQMCGLPGIADNDGNLSYLRRDYISKIYGRNSYLLVDFPRHYYLYGKGASGGYALYCWPYFSIPMQFMLDYSSVASTLTAGVTEPQITLPPEYHKILIDRVVARLSRAEGDLTDGDVFDAKADQAIGRLMDAFLVNNDTPDPMLSTPDYTSDW